MNEANLQFKQAYSLEQQLKQMYKERSSHRSSDIRNLQNKCRDAYENCLFLNGKQFKEDEMWISMWKSCFYKSIEDFRGKVRKAKRATDEAGGKTNLEYAQVIGSFQQFLSDAITFYSTLLKKISSNATRLKQQVDAESVYQCNVYLGDLARYKQLHTLNGEEPDFTDAKAYYQQALQTLPDRGNPHNQLGVISTHIKASCLAVYHYCRSLSVAKPFPTSKENLTLLYANNNKEKAIILPDDLLRTKPLKMKDKAPVLQVMQHTFVKMHGILFSNGEEIDLMAKLYTSLIDDFSLLLRSSAIGPDLLNKLIIVNIFSVKHTQSNDEISEQTRGALESLALALAFGIASCVTAHANNGKDKGKLLGALGIFADWLMSDERSVLNPYNRLQFNNLIYSPSIINSEKMDTSGLPPVSTSPATTSLESLARSAFWTSFLAMMKRLPSEDNDDGTGGAAAEANRKKYQLKEEKELAGFTYLMGAYKDLPEDVVKKDDNETAYAIRVCKMRTFHKWVSAHDPPLIHSERENSVPFTLNNINESSLEISTNSLLKKPKMPVPSFYNVPFVEKDKVNEINNVADDDGNWGMGAYEDEDFDMAKKAGVSNFLDNEMEIENDVTNKIEPVAASLTGPPGWSNNKKNNADEEDVNMEDKDMINVDYEDEIEDEVIVWRPTFSRASTVSSTMSNSNNNLISNTSEVNLNENLLLERSKMGELSNIFNSGYTNREEPSSMLFSTTSATPVPIGGGLFGDSNIFSNTAQSSSSLNGLLSTTKSNKSTVVPPRSSWSVGPSTSNLFNEAMPFDESLFSFDYQSEESFHPMDSNPKLTRNPFFS